jgi:hypothetical protein
MDQGQRLQGGGGSGGSVRRARERIAAGLPPEVPQPQNGYGNLRGYDNSRAYQQGQQSARPRQPMPVALSKPIGEGQSVGAAISRPTQVPQWPLAAPAESSSPRGINYNPKFGQQQAYQPPSGRGQAPQRPPRPSHVPSMLDASKLQEHTPTFQYRSPPSNAGQEYSQTQDQDEMSQDMKSPMTNASRSSTVSSVGSIPDFPLPVPQMANIAPARRSANLGPPPSSRRGASSYYSNISYVSPIPEESPRTNLSHGSYASSAAMPLRWEDDRDHLDRYYEDERYSEGDFSPNSPPTSPGHTEETNLVRSASFGRKGKPTVVTMGGKVPERDPSIDVPPQRSNKLAKMGVFGPEAAAAAAAAATRRPMPNTVQPQNQRHTAWPTAGNPASPLAGGTGFIEDSSSSESIPRVGQALTTKDAYGAENVSPTAVDPRVNQILDATRAASGTRSATPPTLEKSFSRLSAIRRPPRLDIDAVREAEARGSLTSLPDLIRRATKLAAMMDKGRRPASRNALADFNDDEMAMEKEMGSKCFSSFKL